MADEKGKILELFVQAGGVDVGWMSAKEYYGDVHQKHLDEVCAERGHDRELLSVDLEFDAADWCMLLTSPHCAAETQWNPVSVVAMIDGRVVFDENVYGDDPKGIRFVEVPPPFLKTPGDADREWVVGDWLLRGADWSPWKMEVAEDFRFEPGKLTIPFFRIPLETGSAPVALAMHSAIRYDGMAPNCKGVWHERSDGSRYMESDFEPLDGDEAFKSYARFTPAIDLAQSPSSPSSPSSSTASAGEMSADGAQTCVCGSCERDNLGYEEDEEEEDDEEMLPIEVFLGLKKEGE